MKISGDTNRVKEKVIIHLSMVVFITFLWVGIGYICLDVFNAYLNYRKTSQDQELIIVGAKKSEKRNDFEAARGNNRLKKLSVNKFTN